MEELNVNKWVTIISADVDKIGSVKAYRFYLWMKLEKFQPNIVMSMSIMSACSSPRALHWIKEVYMHAQKLGLQLGVRVGNVFVNLDVKKGIFNDVWLLYNNMEEFDVVTWRVMIGDLL